MSSEDILNGLDDVDALIILSISTKGASSTRIQRTALLLSKVLNVNLDPEGFELGGYSETVQERVQVRSLLPHISRYF